MSTYRKLFTTLGLLATLLILPSLETPVGASYQPGEEIPELRGRAHKVYQGEAPDTYVAEFVGSPEFTRSIADGSWVEYSFTDYGNFYTVQHPWWSVAFYDYYTVVYDETFAEVKIYDDRWTVEYLNKQGKWADSSFWGIVRSYEIVADGIKLKRTGNTVIGQREEIYYFRNGSPCKIEIRQTCDQAQTIRFVWKPSGIVADTERQVVLDENDKHAGKVSGLNFYDSADKFVQAIRWYSELDICDNITPVVESSAQGRKATVTFGGFAINAGGIAHLDPETYYPDAHVESATVDGSVKTNYGAGAGVVWVTIHDASTGHNAYSDDDYMRCGQIKSDNGAGEWRTINRGIALFDTANISDDAIVTAAVLSLHGGGGKGQTASNWEVENNVYSSNPASNTDIATTDYDYNDFGTTPYCDTNISVTAWDTAGYNDFIFNADGIAAIDITGISKFSVRDATQDVPDTEPTWENSKDSYANAHGADKGVGFKPTLVVTFTIPFTVTTQAASSIEATTATGNGNITDTGGENCDMRGFVWNTSTHGDPGDVVPPATYSSNITEHGDFGTGTFTGSLTGLDTGTTIYCRAFAHNSAGWSYGNEVTFLTKPAAPTNVSATDGDHTDKVVITWTKSTGATGYKVYEGANLLDTLGDVATYDDTNAPAPTITGGNTAASDGTETAHVALSLSGTGTNNGASRTYKVKALNATGDSTDSDTDTGYRGVGTLTYQWQRSLADSDADYGDISGATSSTYDDTAAPSPTITPGSTIATDGTETAHVALSLSGTSTNDGAGRYYKCVLNATGATEQTSGNNRGYRGVGALTYQWQRSAADSDASYGDIGGATSSTHNDTAAPAGSISNAGNVTASDGTETTHVALSLANETTADGAGRYFQCVLNATGATEQTSASNRGYRTTGAIAYQWQRSAADSDAAYSNIGGGTTDPYNDTGAPADGSGRYFQCIISSTDASNTPQTSDANRGYRSTAPPSALDAPTNFLVTDLGGSTVNITWTLGDNATGTIIRVMREGCAANYTDGELVYSGNATGTTYNGLSLETTSYCVRAWSYNGTDYSESYAEDSIGGEGMLTGSLVFVVVMLTVVAFWRREPLLYMVGIIGWLFMTFYLVNQTYPAENVYLPWAIAGFCLSVTIVMIAQALRAYFSGKEGIPTSQDIQMEHKKKVLQLTQKHKKQWYEE